MKIAVFGLGYVGTVTAAMLARGGNTVTGVDVSELKVAAFRDGRSPVLEPGLDELVRHCTDEGTLRATTDAAEALSDADLSMVCVGTPSLPSGGLDLSHVRDVASEIGANLAGAAAEHLVVVRSTVLPGSCRNEVLPRLENAAGRRAGEGFELCFNPEFLREGCSLRDYETPTRILVGERVPGAGERVLELYREIDAPAFSVALEVAEAVKYADNAFHALKVTFANEIARVCEALEVDGKEVMEIVASDGKLNASSAYLRPGFAFGGSCLPKDLRALTFASRLRSASVPVLEAILASNEVPVLRALQAVLDSGKRRVALLGLTFKPGTDDLRESPLVELAERLIGKGIELTIHDPNVLLGDLQGANRKFLQARLPHVKRLLRPSVDDAVAEADLIVVGHSDNAFGRRAQWEAQGKSVLELV